MAESEIKEPINPKLLSRKLEAVRKGIQSMKELCGEDSDLLADMIEGETELYPFAERVVEQICNDEALLIGLTAIIEKLQSRKKRIENRRKHARNIVCMVMDEADQKTLELPQATITIYAIDPNIIIQDEAKIPSKYWKPKDPTLDKSALRKDANAGDKIPGITLDNGDFALKVRTA